MSLTIVADENIPGLETLFAPLGELISKPGRAINRADLTRADVLLVRSVTRVDRELLAGTPVRFVGTATIGTDHLAIADLEAGGIAWASAPGCNAVSVVEYVFAALAALDRPWWEEGVGVIGCGNVGGLLYRRLKALGVPVRCVDPALSLTDNPDLAPLDEALAQPVVCLHTPLTDSGPHPTRGLLGAIELAQLRPDAVLLNAGRGGVIDEAALKAQLPQQPALKLVLDVWAGEPAIDAELAAHAAIATPHIAGYALDGKLRGSWQIYRALCQWQQRPAALSLAELLPAPVPGVFTPPAGDWREQLQACLRHAYPVRRDDQALRQALTAPDPAAAFDRLRRDYPQRREFHQHTVQVRDLEGPLARALRVLDFALVT